MLYPGYMSYKAMKGVDVSGQQGWLKYWLVFSVLAFFGLLIDSSPLYYKIPLYVWIKVGIIGYVALPQFKGWDVIYHKVIEPQLHAHEANIDKTADQLYRQADAQVRTVKPKVMDAVNQGKGMLHQKMGKKPAVNNANIRKTQ